MKRLRLALAAAILLWAGSALGYSGSGAIWGMKAGEFGSTDKPGTAAGILLMDSYITPTGFAWVGPGTEGLTIPAYRPGVAWFWYRYDGFRVYGTPFEAWPGGVRRFRADSTGVAITGKATVSDSLTVAGRGSFGDSLRAEGSFLAQGKGVVDDSLTVHGRTLLGDTLRVAGQTDLNASLDVLHKAVVGDSIRTPQIMAPGGIIARLGPASGPTSGGAVRIVDGSTFPLTVAGVQAANDELKAAGGGTILVPEQANIAFATTPLKLSNRVTLRGWGAWGSTPTFSGDASTDVPFMIAPEDSNDTQQMCAIENVGINGGWSAGGKVGAAIKMKQMYWGTAIRDVLVTNVSGDGIRLHGIANNPYGPIRVENTIVATTGGYPYLIENAPRAIFIDGCGAEAPGRNTAAMKIDGTANTSTSGGGIGVYVNGFRTEVNDTMSVGILIDGMPGVRIQDYDADIPTGRMRAAVQIKNTNAANWNLSPSGVTVQNLYNDVRGDTLIENQQTGETITVFDFNNPYRAVTWYSPAISVGSATTNGRRGYGMVVGIQGAKLGPNIASSATLTPHPDGTKFVVTGTTTSTDVTFADAFIGQTVTFVTSAAWQITDGNHWHIAGNFVGDAAGDEDTITGYVNASHDFVEIARSLN